MLEWIAEGLKYHLKRMAIVLFWLVVCVVSAMLILGSARIAYNHNWTNPVVIAFYLIIGFSLSVGLPFDLGRRCLEKVE